MKNKKKGILLGVVALSAAVATTWGIATSFHTFRLLAYGVGILQGKSPAGKPAYDFEPVAGHDFVAAALGMPLGTVLTNQVLGLDIDCASSAASLVVFDKISSNNIATIATSTSIDIVQQQDNKDTNAFPNRERFVAQFSINPTNRLVGGFLTIAGRLQLNPTNGCPRAIRVEFDPKDHWFADAEGRNLDDKKDHDILRAGLGHAIGVVDVIFNDGTTNTVLLPYMALSVRHSLD
jgi:hypothetical protein